MDFEIIGEITNVETIATDRAVTNHVDMKGKDKEELDFAVCINNTGYEASLEVGKLYRLIPDDEAASHGYLRVIDESGEDYGYSKSRFLRSSENEARVNSARAANSEK